MCLCMCLSSLYGLPSLCVCSVQKLLRRAEEEKSELSLHIAAQEKQFKGLWDGGGTHASSNGAVFRSHRED